MTGPPRRRGQSPRAGPCRRPAAVGGRRDRWGGPGRARQQAYGAWRAAATRGEQPHTLYCRRLATGEAAASEASTPPSVHAGVHARCWTCRAAAHLLRPLHESDGSHQPAQRGDPVGCGLCTCWRPPGVAPSCACRAAAPRVTLLSARARRQALQACGAWQHARGVAQPPATHHQKAAKSPRDPQMGARKPAGPWGGSEGRAGSRVGGG